jgi:acyl-CoA thioesterase I
VARQIAIVAVLSAGLGVAAQAQQAAAPSPVKIVALGDSLTAGYGLSDKDGFVPRLQAALSAKGIAAEVVNAGVSGDTSSDGLARLDWSVPQGTSAVIVELGANDMLRGIKPQITRDALDAILKRLTARHIAVLLCGMRAAPNLGTDYGKAFEAIYPDLAAKYGTLLYPFFLDGVAGNLKLTQPDGMHPNPSGVGVVVQRILPKVEELVVRAGALPPT